MSAGERADRRRVRLLADNRCINCAEKLAFDDIGQRRECAKCCAVRAERHQERAAERRAAGACPQCKQPVEDGYRYCAACRKAARERWEKNAPEPKRHANGPQKARLRWEEVDLATPCERCGLRGEHVCITRADQLARTGPGRAFPS